MLSLIYYLQKARQIERDVEVEENRFSISTFRLEN